MKLFCLGQQRHDNTCLLGSRNVWVTNPSNGYTFSQGPSLMTSRCDLGCAAMSIGAKSIIVAAGGYNVPAVGHSADYPLPIEILDPQLNQWVAGKCMLNLWVIAVMA